MKHLETNKILTNLNHEFRSGYSCESQLLTTINDFLKEHDKGHQVDVAILEGGGGLGGVMVFCTDLNFFFKQLDTFLFFFNCNQTNLFFFLPSQNRIFIFNALYKGVSQYSFLDAMHIAHIYYKFPCYISHLYM
jgi:hypothetical protein